MFDSTISLETKDVLRVEILNSKKPENKLKRVSVNKDNVLNLELKDFITCGSINFFLWRVYLLIFLSVNLVRDPKILNI